MKFELHFNHYLLKFFCLKFVEEMFLILMYIKQVVKIVLILRKEGMCWKCRWFWRKDRVVLEIFLCSKEMKIVLSHYQSFIGMFFNLNSNNQPISPTEMSSSNPSSTMFFKWQCQSQFYLIYIIFINHLLQKLGIKSTQKLLS
jgi:hypothetical protein